jgi:phosphohistidine phosphatase SixA
VVGGEHGFRFGAPAERGEDEVLVDDFSPVVAVDVEERPWRASGVADTLMLLAHNPGLQELGVSLLAERGLRPSEAERIAAGFPTAAAAVLAFDADDRCQLLHFFRPSEHRP